MHMLRKSIIGVIVLIASFVTPGAQSSETEWWGRKLPNIPTQFIFGYGSLINTQSRNSTAGAPIPAIPVRVSAAFGYIRTWNDRSPSGFTALGLRKTNPGENAATINGAWQCIPHEGSIWVYVPARPGGAPGVGLQEPDAAHRLDVRVRHLHARIANLPRVELGHVIIHCWNRT
jgi:hypothetical protein